MFRISSHENDEKSCTMIYLSNIRKVQKIFHLSLEMALPLIIIYIAADPETVNDPFARRIEKNRVTSFKNGEGVFDSLFD